MSRLHAVFLSLCAAAALMAGTAALAHTLHLGATSKKASTRLLVRRNQELDRFEASLRSALSRKPPPLPPVPAVKAPVVVKAPPISLPAPPPSPAQVVAPPAPSPPPAPLPAPAPAPALVAAKTPRVIYKRPPPIIIHIHKHGSEEQDLQQPEGDGGDVGGD